MMFMIISTIVISIIGTLLHFLYDISKHNKIVGVFGAVNESTWEHMKIALTPTFFWSLIDGFIYGDNSNYFLAKFGSLFAVIVLMPLLYYGYKFFLKKDMVFINVLIFYIVIICSQSLFFILLNLNEIDFIFQYVCCVLIFIIFGFYLLLTLIPIKNFLFKDPITNKYGFKGHS